MLRTNGWVDFDETREVGRSDGRAGRVKSAAESDQREPRYEGVCAGGRISTSGLRENGGTQL